ncbi:MAG: nickel-responsive transcriptional regulator NikR [Candidatus Thermoplasmatota archaeon]|jgi:CopG family nickel-responsive transcriptional regulator|nr:nickel-responsive transcriptional regulator NikR [Candidatus Thermoplasmatota archaeon]
MVVERVGISFEPELLIEFDSLIRKKGYTNRSEAVRDLVRKALIEAVTDDEKGGVIGSLTIIYDHEAGGLTDRLMHLQHHHHSEISSTTHIHVDERTCLEVLIVKGKVKDVRRLADNIKALKGVKHGELVLTKTMFEGSHSGHMHY